MIENPLVSIVVVTYNSSKWILETLESIKEQTYKNIELIVSDDCSIDNTVDIVKSWLYKNKKSFISAKLISSNKNTGVTANLNRGIKECKGEWIKDLAGDDALLPDAIEKYVEYVKQNEDIKVCHARTFIYWDSFTNDNIDTYNENGILNNNNKSAKDKFVFLCFYNPIFANTIFINRLFLLLMGNYDEEIKACEDYPMWLRITSQGYNIFFLDKYTAKYRLHRDSINARNAKNLLFSVYFEMEDIIYHKYIKNETPFMVSFAVRYDYIVRMLLYKVGLFKKTTIAKAIFNLIDAPYKIVRHHYIIKMR